MYDSILFVGLSSICYIVYRLRRVGLPRPPGPKSWPIIGNLLDMPAIRPWETYRRWCEMKNSDVVYLDLPMQPILIIGSVEAATDLLDKRSQHYSSRVHSVMFDLMDWDFSFAFQPYDAEWRAHRRMFHDEFNQNVISKYKPTQLEYARMFLSWTVKSPQDTRKHVHRLFTSIVFDIVYGKKMISMDDTCVIAAQEAVESLTKATVPGAFWVEFFPFLKHMPGWVPGSPPRHFIKECQRLVFQMRDTPYLEVKAALDDGTSPSSVARSMIEKNRLTHGGVDEAVSDKIARNVAAVSYVAGSDTTSASCESFLVAMAMFPEVQKRAQAELDRVVGPNHLPEFADLESMPYIQAVVMETTRWMPVAPTGVPHAVTSDNVYKGYHIPKGALVITNAWAMLHNPKDYPDPEQFNPERFLDANGEIDPSVRDPGTIAFGFGRRICPGRQFSNNTMSIFIASVLHVFDITPGVDASGEPVFLSADLMGAFIASPREVPCGLKPRSETAARLISQYAVELEA